jgi:hypothetical protein
MSEPDVALTDYGLAIECAVFAFVLYRANRKAPLRSWFTLFFASTGVAALLGGTVHGFFPDTASAGYRFLWPATLIAIGLTAMAAWMIAASLGFAGRAARYVRVFAALDFAVYSVAVLLITHSFALVVINYLPAALFLLIAFLKRYSQKKTADLLAGIWGLFLTFVAAAVQAAGVELHPVYFSHNALYHVIQAVALFLIFRAARSLIWTCSEELRC